MTSKSTTPTPSPMSPVSTDMVSESQEQSSPNELTSLPNASPPDAESSPSISNAPKTTAGRVTSKAWEHFDKLTVGTDLKAKCKMCGLLLLGDPSQGKMELSPYSYDKELARKELAKMIIIHEYPLKMVDHEGFRSFCKSLNPIFNPMSRNTIKADCLKIYESEKEATMQIFGKNESRIAITTDMWTSSFQRKGFMAVTAHYVDNNWKLNSRIIGFLFVPSPHTSEVLCEALLDCLLDWNIDRKLSSITVDNCSTNDAMLKLLLEKLSLETLLVGGKLFHMRCCAHILNLIVKDGLDVIEKEILAIRDSVAYWSSTQKKWEKFEEAARQVRVPITKKLALDCKTRWNSTYLMLQVALEYKDVFARLKHRDSKYKCCPSDDDWKITNEICGKLKVFYIATEIFSGTQYPTANLYFPNICDIKLDLVQWQVSGVKVIESMASKMIEKFDKYWSIVNGLMGVAVLLDPRYKTDLLDYCFGKIYGLGGENEVHNILTLCRELHDQYERDFSKEASEVCGSLEGSQTTNSSSLSEYNLFRSQRKRKPMRSELDHYLEEESLPDVKDFDVLSWWKLNKGKYPILSQMTKDILAISVSTVASESAFSTSGRLIGPHRSRLHPKTIEALMCAQNWLSIQMKDGTSSENAHASVLYDSDVEGEQVED